MIYKKKNLEKNYMRNNDAWNRKQTDPLDSYL